MARMSFFRKVTCSIAYVPSDVRRSSSTDTAGPSFWASRMIQ
jgi:hypothetical protein